MDKDKKYRQKCKNSGLCPRCGKQSYLTHRCLECIYKLKLWRCLEKMVKDGVVTKTKNRYGKNFYKITQKESE